MSDLTFDPNFFSMVGAYSDAIRDLGFIVANIRPLPDPADGRLFRCVRYVRGRQTTDLYAISATSPRELRDKLMLLL